MSAKGKRWLARVVQLHCIFCHRLFGPHVDTAAEAHHVREPRPGQGGQRPRNDEEVLPACPSHHRYGPLSIHMHKAALLDACGVESEQQLLDEVRAILGEPK